MKDFIKKCRIIQYTYYLEVKLLMKKKKLYKSLLILLVLIYALITLVSQQKVINQYSTNSKELASKISEQETQKAQLTDKKKNVNSKEYIEQVAREKLDMYYPNEKIYVDKGM